MKLRPAEAGVTLVTCANTASTARSLAVSEVLAERWTPIIVRNLLNGCHTFSEIRQGAPGIPTALLSQRLETLERAGVLLRQPAESGRGFRYKLTPMGQ